MRNLFIILSIAALPIKAISANDTLTRASVYDFAINDTFGYLSHKYFYQGSDNSWQSDSTYTSYVITDIQWALDSSAKYITRKKLFSAPATVDTLANPNQYELSLDTNTVDFTYDSMMIGSLPVLWGQPQNSIYLLYNQLTPPILHFPYHQIITFAKGFGEVKNIFENYIGGGGWNGTETELIYYSGSHGTFGNPYIASPTGINKVITDVGLNVYPNPCSGLLTVTCTVPNLTQVDFQICNHLGQTVYSQHETNLCPTYTKMLDLSNLPNSVYFVELVVDGEISVKEVVKQ